MSEHATGAATAAPPRHLKKMLLVALGALAVLLWLWLFSDQIRQMQILLSYAVVLLFGIVAMLWLLFLSGLPLRIRSIPVLALLAAAVVFFSLVRVRGVTGDWLPVLEWRFAVAPEWGAGADGSSTGTKRAAGTSDSLFDVSPPAAFPRFLGAEGDSTVAGIELARDWQLEPPQQIWRRAVGAGWSGFAIAGGMAFTMEQRGELEMVVAYELDTGEELWSHGDDAFFSNPAAGPGPRATPTLSPERVFTFGSTGLLSSFEIATGELVWQHNPVAEANAWMPDHGKVAAPLLVDDLVVVNPGAGDGGSLAAFRQEDGEPVWRAGSDRAAYSPPLLVHLAGQRQILIFNHASVVSHDPADGGVLWQHEWPDEYPNVAPPVVVGPDLVMFSTGYGIGSKLLRVKATGGRMSAELVWETPRMKAKFSNPVFWQGSVYGLDDGVLVCLDPQTGERRWKRGRYGHGNLLLVGDLLLVQSERGDMILIDPDPDEHRELGRFTALKGKAWNPFAIAGEWLLVRNDQEAALWKLPLRAATTEPPTS
jgi:outer membrane protein assembly factor BamB